MHRYVIVDVFTDTPLQGNPVAVFTDGEGLGGDLMQATGRELNLSETVFVLPAGGDGDALVRIFTPTVELPFAGHPLLGTAFVLGEQRGLDRVRLETAAGTIAIELTREGERVVFGEMEQPIPTWEPLPRAPELLAALGVPQSGLPVEVYDNGPRTVFVELEDDAAVAALRPDLGALSALGRLNVSCFAVTGRRVRTRMFAPGIGVAEDPATGSAAGPLAVHLARHRRTAFGDRLEIRQGIEISRPSTLYAAAEGSEEAVTRVAVGGNAVIVARGEYRL